MLRAHHYFVAFALIGAMAAAVELASYNNQVLERVVVAHRHGARTSVFNINGTCDKLGCGTLTEQGALMLRSLGNTFRSSYGGILPGFYDVRSIQSVSDDSTRVIQSASAFLEGLFEYNQSVSVYPGVSTTDASIIRPWSNPGFHMHQDSLYVEIILNLTSTATAILPTADVVAIAQEIGLSTLECDIVPVLCIAQEVDYLASIRAEGRLGEFPLGEKYFPKLNEILLIFFRNLERHFDVDVKHDSFFADSGFPGALLANAMLSAAQDESLTIAEFSGHDTSLMPLFVALGDYDFEYPPFGTAVVFEIYNGNPTAAKRQRRPATHTAEWFEQAALKFSARSTRSAHKKAKATAGVELYVRPLLGVCDQVPGAHNYTWTSLNLTCLSAAGDAYRTSTGCPLDDLQRYISTIVPQNTCYAWPADLLANECDPTVSPQSPSSDSACAKYRAACPFVACGPNRAMAANLSCVPAP